MQLKTTDSALVTNIRFLRFDQYFQASDKFNSSAKIVKYLDHSVSIVHSILINDKSFHSIGTPYSISHDIILLELFVVNILCDLCGNCNLFILVNEAQKII
jgi:hypothetical protein